VNLVDLFVVICFLVGAVSAALVALHPNILYAAIALVFALLSVSGLYGALGADFLAGAQLIIYVGGIIVVILFAIMMSENIYRKKFLDGATNLLVPFLVSLVIFGGLFKLLHSTPWAVSGVLNRINSTEPIGRALIGPYALVFQYVAIVLLSGLIGAVVVARPHIHEEMGPKKRD
jgi:NADH:ubiquinone oxidoreductase subunit 6 (subunit J)